MSELSEGPDERAFDPPMDQQPVDQQPLPPRQPTNIELHPSLPQLPGGGPTPAHLDGPAMAARPAGAPLIPPLQTTSPVDFVDAESSSAFELPPKSAAPVQSEPAEFEPLRSDSPPWLMPTWWLRSALLVVLLAAPAAALWVEYHGVPDDALSSTPVIGLHILGAVLLVMWSFFAMRNAARIVPPSMYQHRASGSVAVLLWVLAGLAPLGVVAGARRLADGLDNPDDMGAVFVMIAIVLLAFLLLWLPFRYHARQASRVGAPHQAMIGWFFAPMLAAVGGVTAVALGLGELLREDGLTPKERVLQVAVAYALPMVVFALATWRAVTVFDEVIDLRWRRWKTEWEQTLGRMAAEPPPGPEASPSIEGLIER